MLGAAGALGCLSLGTALGCWLKERRSSRCCMLSSWCEALGGMRLLLEQERLSMPDLLTTSATWASHGTGGEQVAKRLMLTAEAVIRDPFLSLCDAYALACAQISASWEMAEEKEALQSLFSQLGSGTAAMREQAVAACLRRLRPLADEAYKEAQRGGRLCMQLGMILGLMAGIALW